MVPVRQAGREINASDIEHIGALTVGGVLLLKGLLKGGPLGLVYKVGGLALLYRGQQGYRPLYDALGIEMPAGPTGVGKVNARADYEVVVNRPREEIYRIWRNLQNLPIFMDNLVSVHEIDDKRSIWVAKGPAGTVVKWDAEIINDVPNEIIAWQSLEGSGVDNAGSVNFEDAGDGSTRIKVVIRYDPPADQLGVWLAKATGRDAQREIEEDLERFKAIMEIGGATANASAGGRGRKASLQ
ncbi:SRPBCC family protein [bacterium]|nr:MAG: SRPBCC family protein [bacterium]